jgi:hypothetical protein
MAADAADPHRALGQYAIQIHLENQDKFAIGAHGVAAIYTSGGGFSQDRDSGSFLTELALSAQRLMEGTHDAQISPLGTDVVLPRPSRARRLRRAAGRDRLAGAGSGAAAEHGAGLGSATAERIWGQCRSGGSDGLCQWRTCRSKRAGNCLLPRFPAREPTASRCKPTEPPANLVDTLQLAPGTQAHVQVHAVPNREVGSTAGGASFAVLSMSPQEAQSYLPMMANLGQR